MDDALRPKIEVELTDVLRTLEHYELVSDKTLPLMKVCAEAVAEMARANALAKGGRNFWQDIAKSCRVRKVTAASAEIYSNRPGAALRQFGGTIRPVNARALTIPIADEAKGKTAAEFAMMGKPLFVIKGKGESGILAWSDQYGGLHPVFVLRGSVYQKPDPWWPADEEILSVCVSETEKHINRSKPFGGA